MYRALAPGAIGVRVPFEEAVALAARHGFAGIDVNMGVISDLGLDTVQRLLASHKLMPALTGMPVNFRDDDAAFQRDLDGLDSFAQTMAALGCTRAATWFKPWHETLTYEERFARMVDRVRQICLVVGRYGMRFGLEFVGPETLRRGKPNHFIYDIDGLLKLIAAVNVENLGFLLDAFHWYTSGGTRQDLDRLSDDLVVVVHVNDAVAGRSRTEQLDNERAMPGETGVIDTATFMQALNRMGYSGPVMVEPFSQRIRDLSPEQAVRETAASLDRIWELAG